MTLTFSPDLATQALKFASTKHASQKIPGSDLPYILHPVMVIMELIAALEDECRSGHDTEATKCLRPDCQVRDLTYINNDLAVQCALLLDVLEDTPTTNLEIESLFGTAVADGVLALSKNKSLPKEQQLEDSLSRILFQPKEIWMVNSPPPKQAAPSSAFHTSRKLVLQPPTGCNLLKAVSCRSAISTDRPFQRSNGSAFKVSVLVISWSKSSPSTSLINTARLPPPPDPQHSWMI